MSRSALQSRLGSLAQDLEDEADWVYGQRDFVGSQARTVGIMRRGSARIRALEDALRDCTAFLRGDIAGPAQKEGILREAESLIDSNHNPDS